MTLESLAKDPRSYADLRGQAAEGLARAMGIMEARQGLAQIETHWIWFLKRDVLRAFAVPKTDCSEVEFTGMMKRIVSRE